MGQLDNLTLDCVIEEYEKLVKVVHTFEVVNRPALYVGTFSVMLDSIFLYSECKRNLTGDNDLYHFCTILMLCVQYIYYFPMFFYSLYVGEEISGQIDDLRFSLIKLSEEIDYGPTGELLIKHQHAFNYKPFLDFGVAFAVIFLDFLQLS